MPRALTKGRINELVKRYRPRRWQVRESEHRWRVSSASADSGARVLSVPSLIDADALFLYFHEVGHVRLGHFDLDLPNHREEFAAERFAVHVFRTEGIVVTKIILADAKTRVRHWIKKDRKKGIPIQHHIARWANKRCVRGRRTSR